MRFYLIPIFFVIFGLNFVNAQRFGYIDTDFILNKMPEYKKAQEEVNKLSELWEKEIVGMSKGIESMYSSLQEEQVLLTEAMRKERTDAIKKKEAELKEYQKKVFGFGGLFFLKKQELNNDIHLSFESIGFGGVEKEVSEKAEKLLVSEQKSEPLLVGASGRSYSQ